MQPTADTPLHRDARPADELLVLLAHNDDEFFISPLLAREIASGNRIRVVYLTHGSVYGADSAARIAESQGVLQALGLAPDRVLLLGAQADIFDGSLAAHAGRACQALLAALAGTRVDRLWTLAWEGGHPDHDAANIIGAALAAKLGCAAFEFPAYNARGLPGGLFRVMAFPERGSGTQTIRISLKEGFAALWRASHYRSQRRTFLGLAPGAALELLWHRRQQLRPLPPGRDAAPRPHAGPLFYERRFGTTFKDLRAALQPLLARAPAASDYSLRPQGTTDADIQCTTALLRQVWPQAKQFDTGYLRWLYAQNPAGAVIGSNAWVGGELVGHYALIPIDVEFRGRRLRAALSLNTAVHPAHQGRGLFVRLAEEAYAAANLAGIHHVIGVANANSTPGFLGRLGFTHLGALEAKLIWGRPHWPQHPSQVGWRRAWTAESYRWRIANPSATYRVARAGDRLLCLASTGELGIQAVMRAEQDAGFQEILRTLPAAPAAPLKLWIGLDPGMRLSRLAGSDVPVRLRRSPLNLIYRALTDDSTAPAPESMAFDLLDFDAY